MKKRAANAAQENAGINHVRHITDREEHIFRRVHEEDVGVDAHIELCHRPEEPSGQKGVSLNCAIFPRTASLAGRETSILWHGMPDRT